MNRNIQGLRAIAAYSVVIHHLINSLNHYIGHFNIRINAGAAGVDLFFVISGFVMALTTSTRNISPGEFIRQRIIRIVPIYWLLTFACVAALLLGIKLFNTDLNLRNILESLFFIPDANQKPLLFVGWTLNYEMSFYLLFAFFLFVQDITLRLSALICAIIILWLIGLFGSSGSLVRYAFDGIILEFALGVALWGLSQKILLNPVAAYCSLAIGVTGLLFSASFALPAKLIVIAPAAGLVVFAAICLERRGLSIGDGFLRRQGDASYSIYLLHPLILQFVGKIALVSHLTRSYAGLCITVTMMIVMTGLIGTWFHSFVEIPLTNRLKSVRGSMASKQRSLNLKWKG